MFRKLLLPALATALLAGCATDYTYRGGSGDYYYGRPQVEYRTVGPYGYPGFGGYFGYGIGYGSYGPYGLFGYGSPYGYYGSPYWGPWQPRPPRPGHGHGDAGDADGDDRPPPWRDFGRMAPREGVRRADDTPRARDRDPAPVREQRSFERRPQLPSMRNEGSGGSSMGRAVRGARSRSGSGDE